MALGNLLQGYLTAQQRNEQTGMQQFGVLQKILAQKQAAQEAAATQAFREKQLGAQREESAARLAETAEARKSREAANAATLDFRRDADVRQWETRKQMADMEHRYRLLDLDRKGATDADKLAETQRHNKAIEDIQGKLAELKATTSPEARKATEKQEGKQSLTSLLDDLSADYMQLEKLGSDISSTRSAGANVINRIASSGAGQLVAGAVGTESQAVRDSIASKRASLMTAIKAATGMGSTQLNSNVELQFYLRMATDPTMAREANQKAIKWLRDTYGIKGAATAPAASPGDGPLSPEEQAELEALRKRFGNR